MPWTWGYIRDHPFQAKVDAPTAPLFPLCKMLLGPSAVVRSLCKFGQSLWVSVTCGAPGGQSWDQTVA